MEKSVVSLAEVHVARERHRQFINLFNRLPKQVDPRIPKGNEEKSSFLSNISAQLLSTGRSVLTSPQTAELKNQVLPDLQLLLGYSPTTLSFKDFVVLSFHRAIETGESDDIPKPFKIGWLRDDAVTEPQGLFLASDAIFNLEFIAYYRLEYINSILQDSPVRTIRGQVNSDWTPFVPLMEKWRVESVEKYGEGL